MTQGLGLTAPDDTPIVARGAALVTRGDLKQRTDLLVDRLRAQNVARAMVCSDDPVDLLRAIDACHRAGSDLFIAHTSLSAALIDEIIQSFGVALRIGATDEAIALTMESPPAPAARIFMMTSGTTGRPKIATHSLESLLARVRAGLRQGQAIPGKWLLTYQPTGFAGLQVALTATLTGGLVVAPEQRNPAGFFAAAQRWNVTQISGTPTFWRSFLMAATPGALALQQVTLGGEAADQATLNRVKAAFPSARVTHTYASTEAGMVFAVHDGLEGFPSAWLEQPRQGAEVRVRDGFLQIKTPHAMRGYLNEAAQPLLADGWLTTADRCEVTGDRARIMGRDDSTINVGGYKVYPLAIERFLLGLPGVAEARVYGSPNPISGFLVGADVVLDRGADPAEARPRILAACREGLAGYQVPRVFKIVETIEVSASGKKG
jgi:acyl-coenzyme A synthetase/AMP-(fatty) acid ligase